MEAEVVRKVHPEKFYETFLSKKVRPDGRKFTETRETNFKVGSISTCDGSCLVKNGNTSILTGIRCEYAQSTELKPNGEIILNFELSPLSPKFEFFKDKKIHQSIINSISENVLNENLFDFSKLDIMNKDKKVAVWVLFVDVYCLEYDGSLLDACLLSVVGALNNCKKLFYFLKTKK
jgi:exosome complex component RRP43